MPSWLVLLPLPSFARADATGRRAGIENAAFGTTAIFAID
jgi:hypothetical protein